MVGDMSDPEDNHQSCSSILPNNTSASRRARRTAIDILFDEEPIFSDSEDETQFTQISLPIPVWCPSVKTPSNEKVVANNTKNSQISNLLIEQLLLLGCDHCVCCKKIQDFLKLLPTTELSKCSPSSSSCDSGLGSSNSHDGVQKLQIRNDQDLSQEKITSNQTSNPSKSSNEADNLNKRFDLLISNFAENVIAKTTEESTGEITSNKNLIPDSSIINRHTPERNSTVMSTNSGLWKINKENVNTVNNFSDNKMVNVTTQKLKRDKKGWTKEKMGRKKKILVGKDRKRQINQKVNNFAVSLKVNSCALPGTMDNPKEYDSAIETVPYNLKSKLRSTNTSTKHSFKKPLFNILVDTTSHRSFSKAIIRKLGRTGGISFDIDYFNKSYENCKSYQTRRSRTLYSSDEWLNSNEFLMMNGDE